MLPNTTASWVRGSIGANGKVANFASVKAVVPLSFFNKRSETISGGVRTRLADARMVIATAHNEEVREGDRFVIAQNGRRYRVTVAESSAFGPGFYWYCQLMEAKDDAS